MRFSRKSWAGPAVLLVAFALLFAGAGTASAAPASGAAPATAVAAVAAAPSAALAYNCEPYYYQQVEGRWGIFAGWSYTWTTETARGQNNSRVIEVQCLLLFYGISVGPKGADGDFGGNTEAGVIEAQRRCYPNTPSEWDGRVGPKTWTCLRTYL